MRRETYPIEFNTPAFLGNAEQRAEWRTPPLKALLRQWWRVLAAQDCGFDLARLRREEGGFFGSASDDGEAVPQRSQVRIRLDGPWATGILAEWPKGEPKLEHPEVKFPVGAELYLGYGPLGFEKGSGTAFGVSKSSGLKRNAIDPKTQPATLKIAAPDDFPLDDLMTLIAHFGTLGSRSRNGWGSLCVEGVGAPGAELLKRISRPLDDCLRLDWPHALGRDARGPLLWQTPAQADWRASMKELARVKIAFRAQFKFSGGAPHRDVEARHLLAYPVTNHRVGAWGNEARNANQLRFKVLRQNDRFVGTAFHLPGALPLPSRLTAQGQAEIWRAVHAVLDKEMQRMGAGR